MLALVVDDARVMRKTIAQLAQELGFETVEAEDGRDAINTLKSLESVDVMFVDWNMPNMNGIEFVTAIRSDNKFAQTKVLMVTMETDMEKVVRALEAGADEYVMKPFTKDSIREKLALMDVAQPNTSG